MSLDEILVKQIKEKIASLPLTEQLNIIEKIIGLLNDEMALLAPQIDTRAGKDEPRMDEL